MLWTLAAEAPNGNWIPGDINEFYWGTIAFLLVVGLMVWKGAGPVKAALAGRSQRISDELSAADRAAAEAESRRQAEMDKLGDADAEASKIVSEARANAEQLRVDLRARAEADVEASKQRAQAEIAASKSQAMADIRAEVGARTARATEAVVADSLDQNRLAALIDNYISEVGA